jgi:ribonuclease HII
MLFLRYRLVDVVMESLTWLLLLGCSMIRPSTSFMIGNNSVYPLSAQTSYANTMRKSCKTSRNMLFRKTSRTTSTTRCWGKYSRNTTKRTRIDTDDILSYERSLITDRGYSYILGSDETGRGSIAGPVVTATCCILTLTNNNENENGEKTIIDASDLPTVGLLSPPADGRNDNNSPPNSSNNNNNINSLIKDSKQLSPEDRERIYEAIVNNPQVYAFSVAQRSNTEIDDTSNIQLATMDAFQESIEDLAENTVFPYIFSRQQNGSNSNVNTKDTATATSTIVIPDDWEDCGCYGIVDGKKSPKISTLPSFPSRPMVQADKQVYTVALASIIAKVTLDRMFKEWHKEYPNYGFDQNLGYATKDHIEAIHKYGPCPLHRMTFKSLKGR